MEMDHLHKELKLSFELFKVRIELDHPGVLMPPSTIQKE